MVLVLIVVGHNDDIEEECNDGGGGEHGNGVGSRHNNGATSSLLVTRESATMARCWFLLVQGVVMTLESAAMASINIVMKEEAEAEKLEGRKIKIKGKKKKMRREVSV